MNHPTPIGITGRVLLGSKDPTVYCSHCYHAPGLDRDSIVKIYIFTMAYSSIRICVIQLTYINVDLLPPRVAGVEDHCCIPLRV